MSVNGSTMWIVVAGIVGALAAVVGMVYVPLQQSDSDIIDRINRERDSFNDLIERERTLSSSKIDTAITNINQRIDVFITSINSRVDQESVSIDGVVEQLRESVNGSVVELRELSSSRFDGVSDDLSGRIDRERVLLDREVLILGDRLLTLDDKLQIEIGAADAISLERHNTQGIEFRNAIIAADEKLQAEIALISSRTETLIARVEERITALRELLDFTLADFAPAQ